ncbi:GGDEF domain-containing protein [Lacticaseibacillus sp. GG6-2]
MAIVFTYLFLLFFHVDSLLNIANTGHRIGYGWTFLNFQLATILYAVLSARAKAMIVAMMAITGTWFVWMNTYDGLVLGLISLALIAFAHHFSRFITARRYLYYPFGLIFATPAFIINYQSLKGIDVGWPFQIIGFIVLEMTLWGMNWYLNSQAQREAKLRKNASVDSLTQLANFGQFDKDLHAAFDRYQDHNELYSLYTFDIDHFKQINDEFGHLCGNEVLRVVANRLQTLTEGLEYQAKIYRTGGEEFSILLFDVVESYQRATEISQQLRCEIHRLTFNFDDTELHITISLGQDRAISDDKNYLDLYRRADAYLYASKNHGRDAATIRGQIVR